MIYKSKYKGAKIIFVLALFSFVAVKGQNISDVLLKCRKAYDTTNIITDSRAKIYNSMNPDTTKIHGKLYYRNESLNQHFLLETPNWHFIRNNKNFGYNDERKKEYETFASKKIPPFLLGWLDNELLLPFMYDTSFFRGRFINAENNVVSLSQNDSCYIIKKHHVNSGSSTQEPFTIDETYLIDKKTFLIKSRIQHSESQPNGMEFKQTILTWYKYSHTAEKVINDKIDGFKPYPAKIKVKD
jgi:hypothetical protein